MRQICRICVGACFFVQSFLWAAEEGFTEEVSHEGFINSKLWEEGAVYFSETQQQTDVVGGNEGEYSDWTPSSCEDVQETEEFEEYDAAFVTTPSPKCSRIHLHTALLFWQTRVPCFDARHVDFLMNGGSTQEKQKRCLSTFSLGFRVGLECFSEAQGFQVEWTRHQSSASTTDKMYKGLKPIAMKVMPTPWLAASGDELKSITIHVPNLGIENMPQPISCFSELKESIFNVFDVVQNSPVIRVSDKMQIRPSFGVRFLQWSAKWRESVSVELPPIIKRAGLQTSPNYLRVGVGASGVDAPATVGTFKDAWGIRRDAFDSIGSPAVSAAGINLPLDDTKPLAEESFWDNPLGDSPLNHAYEYLVQRDYAYGCTALGNVLGVRSTWNIFSNTSLFSYLGLGLLFGESTASLNQSASSNPLYDADSSTKKSSSEGKWVIKPSGSDQGAVKNRSAFRVLEEGDVDLEERSLFLAINTFHPCMDLSWGLTWNACVCGVLHTMSVAVEAQFYREAAITTRYSTEFRTNSDLFGGLFFEHPYLWTEMGFTASWELSF